MSDESITATGSVAALIDYLVARHDLKSDAGLGRELHRDGAYMSKLRKGKLPLTAHLILRIHEHFGMSVQEIRDLSGQQGGRRA